MADGIARQHRSHDGEHRGDQQRDAESHLQGDYVDREECGADQLLPRLITSRHQHGMAMPAQDVGLLIRSERSAARLLPVFHLRYEVLRQLTDDVVLLMLREKEPDRL